MTPSYLSQVYSFPYENIDQDQKNQSLAFYPENKATSNSLKDQEAKFRAYHDYDHHHQVIQEECKDHRRGIGQVKNDKQGKLVDQIPSDQHSGEVSAQGSSKWMPSKMRWMTKMMASSKTEENKQRKAAADHQQQNRNDNNSSPSGGIIRVCSDCKTTKTPLWRSGPQGPKSLCNACGIRQRKARRAMAMAAAVSGGLIPADHHNKASSKVHKVNISERSVLPFKKRCALPFKKRCKMINSSPGNAPKKLQFDDVMISLSNKSSSYKVFPQDEREAAVLLMALSYGLIRS